MIGTTVEVGEAVAGMAAGTTDDEAAGLAAATSDDDTTEDDDDDDDDDEETVDAGKVCAFNCHFSVGTAW